MSWLESCKQRRYDNGDEILECTNRHPLANSRHAREISQRWDREDENLQARDEMADIPVSPIVSIFRNDLAARLQINGISVRAVKRTKDPRVRNSWLARRNAGDVLSDQKFPLFADSRVTQ